MNERGDKIIQLEAVNFSGNLEENMELVNLLLVSASGALLGNVVGLLPSVGPVMTTSLLLAFASQLDAQSMFAAVIGIYLGAQFGGAIPAILLGVPGEVSSTLTAAYSECWRKANAASTAIRISALSSLVGNIVGLSVVVSVVSFSSSVLYSIGDYEVAIILAAALLIQCQSSLQIMSLANVTAVSLGIIVALVGSEFSSGVSRYTFGLPLLRGGVDEVLFLLGIISLPSVISIFASTTLLPFPYHQSYNIPQPRWFLSGLLGGGAGVVLGSIPGLGPSVGAPLATRLVAPALTRGKSGPDHDLTYVAVNEAANNSAALGSLLLLLALGLPANTVTALIASRFHYEGLSFLDKDFTKAIMMTLFISTITGTIILTSCNILASRVLCKISSLRKEIVGLAGLAILILAALVSAEYPLELTFVMLGYFLALACKCIRAEPSACAVAFILTPLLEERLVRLRIFWEEGLIEGYSTFRLMAAPTLAVCLLLLAYVARSSCTSTKFRNSKCFCTEPLEE